MGTTYSDHKIHSDKVLQTLLIKAFELTENELFDFHRGTQNYFSTAFWDNKLSDLRGTFGKLKVKTLPIVPSSLSIANLCKDGLKDQPTIEAIAILYQLKTNLMDEAYIKDFSNWKDFVPTKKRYYIDFFNIEILGSVIEDSLVGIYQAFFVRPLKDELAIGFVVITKSGDVYTKTSKTSNKFYKGKFKIRKYDTNKTIGGNFIYKDDKKHPHEFFFELLIPSQKQFDYFLRGIYGGNNPEDSHPISGRMLLKKIIKIKTDDKTKILNFFQNKLQPYEISSANDLANLFDNNGAVDLQFNDLPIDEFEFVKDISSDNDSLYDFFRNNNFIEDILFLKSYQANSTSRKAIVGDYLIFTTHSDKNKVAIGVARIDELWNVKIKGAKGLTYYGNLRPFHTHFFSIIIRSRKDASKTSEHEPYFINYLFSLPQDKDLKPGSWVQGVRNIKSDKGKASSARFILYKIASNDNDNFFNSYFHDKIKVVPVPFEIPNPAPNSILNLIIEKSKIKSPFDKFLATFTGDENNIISSSGALNKTRESSIKKINYKTIFLESSIFNLRSQETDEDNLQLNLIKFYLKKSILHGMSAVSFNKFLSKHKRLLNKSQLDWIKEAFKEQLDSF